MGDTTDDDSADGNWVSVASPPPGYRNATTRGAAPILGTIMLFGFTFVVVVSVLTLGIGGGLVPTPATQVTWGFDLADSNVTVIHAGGPSIDGTQVRITGTGLNRSGTLAMFGPRVWERGTKAQLPLDPSASNTTVLLIWTQPRGTSIRLTTWSPPTRPAFDGDVPLATM